MITEAVQGLTAKRVGKGRVLGMVYLTAAALKEGQSLGEVTADLGFDFIKMDVRPARKENPPCLPPRSNNRNQGDFMYHDPLEASAATNFSDLPADQGLECAKRFVYHSAPSFGNTLQYAGYRDADNVAFIFCTEDKTLPPSFQQMCIDNINASRTEKSPAKVYKLDASHCPHASRAVDLARVIVDAVREFP